MTPGCDAESTACLPVMHFVADNVDHIEHNIIALHGHGTAEKCCALGYTFVTTASCTAYFFKFEYIA